jgi:hypothetical protein
MNMKIKPIIFLAVAAALALPASVSALGSAAKPAEKKAGPAPAQNSLAVLDKGMSAKEIVELLGQPETVSKLKTDEAKAEKWTYRQLIDHRVVQEATNVGNEAAFVGNGGANNNDQGSRATLQYSLKEISTYRVTALLMVNDHLVLARQWSEQKTSYD